MIHLTKVEEEIDYRKTVLLTPVGDVQPLGAIRIPENGHLEVLNGAENQP